MKNVFFFLQILGKQSKFSETLRPRKEATLRHDIFELGSNNNLAPHCMCSIFFFKITPPYNIQYVRVLYCSPDDGVSCTSVSTCIFIIVLMTAYHARVSLYMYYSPDDGVSCKSVPIHIFIIVLMMAFQERVSLYIYYSPDDGLTCTSVPIYLL